MPFVFPLLSRSWFSFLSSLGTTGLGFLVSNILVFIATAIVTYSFIRLVGGKTAGRKHTAENLKDIASYAIVLVVVYGSIFCYQLFHVIPNSIRSEADRTQSPKVIPPKPPSFAYVETAAAAPPPSFVFVTPAFIANTNMWDFTIKHQGTREVESIDILFIDSDKLQSLRQTVSPQTPVPPSEYSLFMHIEKIYPRGRGSLFAKQFMWKPQSFEHERYAVDISASNGRFHEDLYIELAEGKWTNAAKVEDVDSKKTLFVCRDHNFPSSTASSILSKRNCWPDWIKF